VFLFRDFGEAAMHSRRSARVIQRVAFVLIAFAAVRASVADEPAAIYLRDIKSVFKERCYACHGALQQKGGLRLDTVESIARGGDSGVSLLTADPATSLLVQRISATDLSERMPPEGEPLTAQQIEAVKSWLAAGAPRPENEKPEEDPRSHWAFIPPVKATIPPGLHPIDAFVDQGLKDKGLPARAAADKGIVLRRVTIDLIGLPPTREELHAFLADTSPDAYERVVDRLLADSRYGERWGRHWLDVWRYADWYGRRYVPDVWNSAPQVYRWRNWTADSVNADRGYDEMIKAMLAGDEIADPRHPEDAVATGYLIRNWYALNPNDWMRSIVEHTGKAFMGLTFQCAHCHDHKYDPIAQDDYFRLRAFFEPIGVRQDRVAGEDDPGPFEEYNYGVLRKIQQLGTVKVFDKTPQAPTWFYTGGDERNRVADRGSMPPASAGFLGTLAKIEPVQLPTDVWYPAMRPEIRQSLLSDAQKKVAQAESEFDTAKKTPEQTTLLRAAEAKLAAAVAQRASIEARIAADDAKFGQADDATKKRLARIARQHELTAGTLQASLEELAGKNDLAAAQAKPDGDAAKAPAIDAANKRIAAAAAAHDQTHAAFAKLEQENSYTALGPQYPPTSTGRRKALAEWMTRPDHPLTARVAINHMWMRHFHTPLVKSVADFGRNGAKPTHPELLDWLTVEFVESGWSMKHLHRLMVTSEAYKRQSSVGDREPSSQSDPDNLALWRMNRGRMESEVIRDTLLYLAGELDLQQGGRSIENSEVDKIPRRTFYFSVYPEVGGKSQMGELFDAPDSLDCYRRTKTIVPQQAFALTNSDLVHRTAEKLSSRLWSEATLVSATSIADPVRSFTVAAYETILSRQPTPAELDACRTYLQSPAFDSPEGIQLRASLVRAILNHNDFVSIR
jgi:mono/diheme cytochrome c family protein